MKWVTRDIGNDENGYFIVYGDAGAADRLELDTIATKIRLSGGPKENSLSPRVRHVGVSEDIHVMFDGGSGGRIRSPQKETLEHLLTALREWGWQERATGDS